MREYAGVGAHYFGDLDPRGVLIALRFNRASGIQLDPALNLYRMSLEIGTRREGVIPFAEDGAAAWEWIPLCAAELVAL